MIDLRKFKMPVNNSNDWFENKKEADIKVFHNKPKQLRDAKEKARLERMKNLPPFGDADKDKIPNIFDRRPFQKDKRSKWGLMFR